MKCPKTNNQNIVVNVAKRRHLANVGSLHCTTHCWGLLVFCNLYLQFIAPINLWNKYIDLRLFSKCKEGPFLRPLRSKDNRCWILRVLRLQPPNFVIISESLAANLKKVSRPLYDKQFQSSDLFVFFIVPQKLTFISIAKRKISKSKKSELWNHLSYEGLPYFFEVGSQTFRNDCKISRSLPQNSTGIILWPQWHQKQHTQIFWK